MSSIPHSSWGLVALPDPANPSDTILFVAVTGGSKQLQGKRSLAFTEAGWAFVKNDSDTTAGPVWAKDLLSKTVYASPAGRLLVKVEGKPTWVDKMQAQFDQKYLQVVIDGSTKVLKVYQLAAPLGGCSYFWQLRDAQE